MHAKRAVIFLLAAALPVGAENRGLSPADVTAVRGVLAAYRVGWLANDETKVLALFTADAVLLPHHGLEPVVGEAAIRGFWFPKNGPPTTITALEQPIDQIGGSCEIAWVRGHSSVAWTTGRGAESKSFSNAGTFLTLLRRQADGAWKISHQMWDDPPTQPRPR